jgi:hypothetical protein
VRGEAALIDLTLAEQADPFADTATNLKHITDQLPGPAIRATRCTRLRILAARQPPLAVARAARRGHPFKPLLKNYAVVVTACRSGSFPARQQSDSWRTWLARRYAIQRQLIDPSPGSGRSHCGAHSLVP